MSENTPEAPAETAAADEQATDSNPKPTETVDFWKQKAREQEKRAKDNAAAAARLAEIEESSKSEQQKLAERLAEAEKAAQTARADAIRFKIASKFGVSDEDADLFLTGTDEETLTRQAERLAAHRQEASEPRSPKPDPAQGRSGGGPKSTADSFADFFSKQLS